MLARWNSKCIKLVDELRQIPGSEELVKCIEEFEYNQAAVALEELKKELCRGGILNGKDCR